MSRTPAGGRLPHGPRHVAAALAVCAGLALTACSGPPRDASDTPTAAPVPTAAPTGGPTNAPGTAPVPPRVPAPVTTSSGSPARASSSAPRTRERPARALPAPPPVPAPGARRLTGVLTRVAVEAPVEPPAGPPVELPEEETPDVRTYVRTDDGPVEIPSDGVDHLPTGSEVVADVAGGALVAAGATATRSTTPVPPRRAVHEVVTALVLPPGAQPDATTSASLRATVEGPVSRYWSAQTGGRVRFAVTRTAGWLRVRSSCDDAWGLWAEVSARVGFIPSPRRHLVVLVPKSLTGCFAGLGTIGADAEEGGYSYVRGALPGLVAHELGHNLGLGHSNGLQCDGAADGTWSPGGWSQRCVRAGYRDWYDVMGVSWDRLGTLSTAQAYRLGVLGPDAVTTVSGPARVTLTAVSLRTGLRSLRVRTPAGVVYTVEYRPALGDDAWLAGVWRGLRPGVLVRRDDPQGDAGQTLLLDTSPSRAAASAVDWDVPLAAGATFTAAGGRVAVTVEDQSPTTAQVLVTVDGALPPSGAGGELTRLGSRVAGDGSSRVVRDPAGATATPPTRSPERTRGPVHRPTR